MKRFKNFIASLLFFSAFSTAQEKPDQIISEDFVQIKLTAKVVSEDGLPIEDANIHVRIIFPEQYKDGANDFRGKTNAKGEFTAESGTTSYTVPIKVTKEGYYESYMKYLYSYEMNTNTKVGDQVMPWNPTVPIILKKIGKPVPMYVRTGNRDARYFPSQGVEYGFDLIADDWVAPDGKGTISDIMMKSELFVKDANSHDVKLTVRFPNRGDGWIPITKLEGAESQLKYPREAPMEGYREEPLILAAQIHRLNSGELPKGGHPYGYIFRTRTILDENGSVVSAFHSKIIDSNLNPPIDERRFKNPILFGGSPGDAEDERIRKGCFFAMDYYLNPNPDDRTLEFDRKTNLAREAEREAAAFAP